MFHLKMPGRLAILFGLAALFVAVTSCQKEDTNIDRAYEMYKTGKGSRQEIMKEISSDSTKVENLTEEELLKAVACIDYVGIERSEQDQARIDAILTRYDEVLILHPTQMEELAKKLSKEEE